MSGGLFRARFAGIASLATLVTALALAEQSAGTKAPEFEAVAGEYRSEERRVGKECRL